MIIHDAALTTYEGDKLRGYSFTVNAYWVTVKREGVTVFVRTPQQNDWLDEKHTAITKALKDLETALANAVPKEATK